MSGTTLERLQVIIEASATKYKKEMDAVAQKTQKAEAIVCLLYTSPSPRD